MSRWELIDANPHNGVRKYIGDHPDDPEGCLVRIAQSAKAIETIIDRNKAFQNEATGPMGDMAKVASIPVGVMYEWKRLYNVDAWKYSSCEDTRKAVNKLLNDSDWRYLKCRDIII
jgi:hypothetical protein